MIHTLASIFIFSKNPKENAPAPVWGAEAVITSRFHSACGAKTRAPPLLRPVTGPKRRSLGAKNPFFVPRRRSSRVVGTKRAVPGSYSRWAPFSAAEDGLVPSRSRDQSFLDGTSIFFPGRNVKAGFSPILTNFRGNSEEFLKIDRSHRNFHPVVVSYQI